MNFSNLHAEAPGLTPDEILMHRAVALASKAKGRTAPNPCVGALLVRNGQVVASGYHHKAGEPHAEVMALADAREKGVDPSETTLYVTLEPCNHQGRTPPCTRAIIQAGIGSVVTGTLDPNPDVAGGGVETLREAGIQVKVGVAETACRELIADFLVWKMTHRPYVILKLAGTLDGRIATRTGHSRWVTGPQARRAVHELRARVDAVLVGAGTLRADDPQLTCRLENGPTDQPLALVAAARLSPDEAGQYFLFSERADETVLLTSTENAGRFTEFPDLRVLGLPSDAQGLDMEQALTRARQELDVYTLLCEGGGRLAANLLAQNLVDEFRLHLAPKVLADNEARPLLDGLAPQTMDQALGLRFVEIDSAGQDLIMILRRRED